jgi:hypothetical protein
MNINIKVYLHAKETNFCKVEVQILRKTQM